MSRIHALVQLSDETEYRVELFYLIKIDTTFFIIFLFFY